MPRRCLFAALIMFLLASVTVSNPSSPSMASIATRVAGKFERKHETRILVTDFTFPGSYVVSALGTKYADRFAAALAAANPAISVISRTDTHVTAPSEGLSGNREELNAVWAIAHATGASGVVDGEVDINGNSLQIWINTFQIPSGVSPDESLHNGDRIDELEFEAPLDAADKSLATHIFKSAGGVLTVGSSDSNFPSEPRCLSCPYMRYIKSAVEMSFTVDAKGHVIVQCGVECPLKVTGVQDPRTEARIERDGSQWTFDPALDANGQPVQSIFKILLIPK